MSEVNPITEWIANLEAGDQEAARELWETYFERMVRLARKKLPTHRRAAADEEDVALSAFKSFCKGVRDARFPRLINRECLWPLLVSITAHKAQDMLRREGRLKRGGDARKIENPNWEDFLSREPDPEVPGLIADELARLRARLNTFEDEHLEQILWASLEGESTAEIAERLGCSQRAVQRKLGMIRAELSDAGTS